MKKLIFYTVFFLMFLVGGFLNYFGIMSYKMIFGAALPLLIIPIIRIRLNTFFYFTLSFIIIILLSAILNRTSFLLTLWFLQNAAIPFLMYIVVVSYLSKNNIIKVYKWIIVIASIQLPIIVLQRIFYPFISKLAKVEVSDYDIGFGTFYTSDDIALSFFVLGTILFLLFDNAHNFFVKNRMTLVTWLTFTILVMNSKISYLILAMIWAYYVVSKVKIKVILYVLTAGLLVFLLAYVFGLKEQMESNYLGLKQQIAFNVDVHKAEVFYKTAQGNRPAAILYLATKPLKLLGEGPHAIYNPITNKFNKGGDTSQLISFYVELGIVGLFISYMMIYSIIKGLQYSEFTKLYFLVFCITSIVSNVFLDASITMIFVIFTCSYLVPPKEETLN
jgi:hypothetical protein